MTDRVCVIDGCTAVRPRGSRKTTVEYDALERVADLLARHAAAHARITQALLVLEHPGTGFGARATDLLRDALDELDTQRKD